MSMGYESDLSATVTGSPTYRVGQDRVGRWLVVEASGLSGGMFASQAAAMRFALALTGSRAGSVTLAEEPVAFV